MMKGKCCRHGWQESRCGKSDECHERAIEARNIEGDIELEQLKAHRSGCTAAVKFKDMKHDNVRCACGTNVSGTERGLLVLWWIRGS